MKKNPVAKALRSGQFRAQQVRPRKGKGAYDRKKEKIDANHQHQSRQH